MADDGVPGSTNEPERAPGAFGFGVGWGWIDLRVVVSTCTFKGEIDGRRTPRVKDGKICIGRGVECDSEEDDVLPDFYRCFGPWSRSVVCEHPVAVGSKLGAVANLGLPVIWSGFGPIFKFNIYIVTMKERLDSLPEALIFEICNYLDIFALVALSEVNSVLRTLAMTRTSFWIGTLAHCGLVLPLGRAKTLYEYSASELSVAAHRAVLVERNLSSDCPKLRSSAYFPWPMALSEGVRETEYSSQESSVDAISMHLVDDPGNWMVNVSTNNIVRILHLRTGKIALIWDGARYTPEQRNYRDVRVTWAVEFKEGEGQQNQATMIMNCFVRDKDGEHPGFCLFDINFDPEQSLATIELLGEQITPTMASHLNLAGSFIVMVFPRIDSRSDKLGDIAMLHWPDKKMIVLPELYPSLRIGLYEEYFINVGLTKREQVVAQIVPYPYREVAGFPDIRKTEGRITAIPELPELPLPVFTYQIPYPGPVWHSSEYFSCRICHRYTGERISTVRLCLRPGGRGTYSVMRFSFDFFQLQASLKQMYRDKVAIKWEFDGEPEAYRLLEESKLKHLAVPTSSGRRFLWWRPWPYGETISPEHLPPFIVDSPLPAHLLEEPLEVRFRLFTLVVENLAPIAQIRAEATRPFRDLLKINGTHPPESAAAIQLHASKLMEIPKSLACRTSEVYLFLLSDWSGTALVQLRSGELWVLRYGKA